MRVRSAAGRPAVIAASAFSVAAALAACNAILGTPDPVMRDSDAADVDATTSDVGSNDGPLASDASSDAAVEAGGDAQGPASCQTSGDVPGVTSCGTVGDSCCTTLPVQGGGYFRSYAIGADGGATSLADPAAVSGFSLDEYLVTVGRFRRFVAATADGWIPTPVSGRHTYLASGQGLSQQTSGGTIYEQGWQPAWGANMSQPDGGGLGSWDTELTSCTPSTWTPQPGTGESLPINCTNWFEAYAFCIWDGGFLASEAEWEYAAAGGDEQRQYPWGGADPGEENEYAIFGCDYPDGGSPPSGDASACASVANIAPVGQAPAGVGRWGQLDLGGDTFEHLFDWYDVGYVTPCTDCADLTPTTLRWVRGGSFFSLPVNMQGFARGFNVPIGRAVGGGIRCARAPE